MRPVLALASVLTLIAAALSACATAPGDYPRVRYARAASIGPVATTLAGRPTPEQLDQAERRWAEAVGDAYACRLSVAAVSEAGMIGALELAAMASASRGDATAFDGVLGYVLELGAQASDPGPRPDARRCQGLSRWVADVRREGRDALRRHAGEGLVPQP